jgi:vancomycin resistance protein YoaR
VRWFRRKITVAELNRSHARANEALQQALEAHLAALSTTLEIMIADPVFEDVDDFAWSVGDINQQINATKALLEVINE